MGRKKREKKWKRTTFEPFVAEEGIFKGKTFVPPKQDELETVQELIPTFIERVLRMRMEDVMISDKSCIWSFISKPRDRASATASARIQRAFGVVVPSQLLEQPICKILKYIQEQRSKRSSLPTETARELGSDGQSAMDFTQ